MQYFYVNLDVNREIFEIAWGRGRAPALSLPPRVRPYTHVNVDAEQDQLLRVTAQQVAQVCDTLEQTGDVSRLARFLWSLPTDSRSTAVFNQFEAVLKARALIAFHSGQFHHLYRILTTYRFVYVKTTLWCKKCTIFKFIFAITLSNRIKFWWLWHTDTEVNLQQTATELSTFPDWCFTVPCDI